MPSNVYILAHKTEPFFKIGKADDIHSRARCFGSSAIDFKNSLGLQVETSEAAYSLEHALQHALRKWRQPGSMIAARCSSTDGATEWFSADGRERLELLLVQIEDLHSFTRIPGEELARIARQDKERKASTAEERQRRREAKIERQELIDKRRSERRAKSMRELREDFERVHLNFSKEFARQLANGTVAGVCGDAPDALILIKLGVGLPLKPIWLLDSDATHVFHPSCGFDLIMWGGTTREESGIVQCLGLELGWGPMFSPSHGADCMGNLLKEIFAEQTKILRALPRIYPRLPDVMIDWDFFNNKSKERDEARHAAARELIAQHTERRRYFK